MMKPAALILSALFIFSLSIEARTVTAYRTIIAATDTEEGAMTLQTEGSDVIPYRGQYVVVSGWFDDFVDALPEGNNEVWNQRWRHVLPVEMPAEAMKAKGLRVAELKTEKALRSIGGLPVRLNNREQLSSRMNSAVDYVKNTEMQPGAKTADLVAALTPQVEAMIQLAERSPDPAEAEEAQLWLAKTYYLEGLMHSKRRLPETSGNHKRQAYPEEEQAYDTALENYKTFLERFPNSEHAENVAYHIAATQYHLTYRGHHRHQVEKAKLAYESFIENYPNSERVTRAKMNLLGISLELARMDQEGFTEVARLGESLLSEYPNANSYIRSRASLIVAESYFEGEHRDYEKTIEASDDILDEFIDSDHRSVIGSAYQLKAYSLFVLGKYDEAIRNYTMFIDFFQDPQYQFGYQVEDNIAGAYYWRGRSLIHLGRIEKAVSEFELIIEKYPLNTYADQAKKEIEYIAK